MSQQAKPSPDRDVFRSRDASMMTFETAAPKHCYWALFSSLTTPSEKAAAQVRLDEIRAQGKHNIYNH